MSSKDVRDGTDDEEECQYVVPVQVGTLKHNVSNDTEYCQRDALLNDLQLNKVEWPSILYKAQSVGWYLTAVFKEGDAP